MQMPCVVSQSIEMSSALCRADIPPVILVFEHESIMWDIVWGSLHSQRSLLARPHFLRQALQGPWPMRKRFNRDHSCRGCRKPGCRIAGSSTRVELTTFADRQSSLQRAMMSVGAISSHRGCLDFSRWDGWQVRTLCNPHYGAVGPLQLTWQCWLCDANWDGGFS
jgi:hypothetical protein